MLAQPKSGETSQTGFEWSFYLVPSLSFNRGIYTAVILERQHAATIYVAIFLSK